MAMMDTSPGEIEAAIRDDPDLAEHVRTYAHFKTLALWGAIALPFIFAFVLFYTQ